MKTNWLAIDEKSGRNSYVNLYPDELTVESALTLIDEQDLEFYRHRSRPLAQLGYADPWIDDTGGVHEALSAA